MTRNPLRSALSGVGTLAVRVIVLVATIAFLLAVVAPANANAYTT